MLKALLLGLLLIPLSSFAFFSNDSGSSLKSAVSQHAGTVKDMGFKHAQKLYDQLLGTEEQQQKLLHTLVDHYPKAKRCVTSGTSVSSSLDCLKSFFKK